MLVGGIASILKVRHGLTDAIKVLKNNRNNQAEILRNTEKNISPKLINVFSILLLVFLIEKSIFQSKNQFVCQFFFSKNHKISTFRYRKIDVR